MIAASPSESKLSILFIEGAVTAISFAAAFAWPRLFVANWFSRVESMLGRLARRRLLAVLVVGLSVIILRLAILPWFPIPLPFVPDDFSFLLGGETFAHGRLANPTPAMWVHFETIHIDMLPTYVSMYFPGQALFLAAGKVLLGNPWFGQLIASALMCAAICWMLQAWLPPGWALLGGAIAVLRLGLFTYWINSYTGGGSIAALGGALVLGALPRLTRAPGFRYGALMATGMGLLVLTRPYEGLLLCLPVTVALAHWVLRGKRRPAIPILLRRAAVPIMILAASIAWLGYYDFRAFGNPLSLPYTVNRTTYAVAPYYVWQSRRPEPTYRHEALRSFYNGAELKGFSHFETRSGFIEATTVKIALPFLFFAGFLLLPPLLMIRRVFLDRRVRFLVIAVLFCVPGMTIQIYLIPHYLAPYTAAFYAIGLQAMRHIRLWAPGGKAVGMALVRSTFTLCVLLAVLRLFSASLGLSVSEWPANDWSWNWYGPDHYGTERAQIESRLEHLPGKQIAVVRFGPERDDLDQWVYNSADIDQSKVIWAQEMDAANNLDLLHYYKDRTAWLVRMDTEPATVTPYPVPQLVTASAR